MTRREDAMTHSPRLAAQFPTRKAAADHAALLGWRKNDAREITVMGFRLWAIMNGQASMLTWGGLAALMRERGAPNDPACPCRAHEALRAEVRS